MNSSPPAPIRVVVSSLFFYKEELATEFLHSLMPQLVQAAHLAHVRLVLTLNYPFNPALWNGLEQWAAAFRHRGVEFELVRRGYNAGFGTSHAELFEREKSDIFVVLNNDLFCEREDWLTNMILRLGPAGEADLVGGHETRTWLRPTDGIGVLTDDPEQMDFVDGSILGFRSETVRRLGLFSRDFLYFCYEDTDLLLRLRQGGARLETIELPHRHLRSASSILLPRYVTRQILDLNRAAFFARWSGYLAERKLHGRIRADLSALSAEDCLEALPALIALQASHAGAQLELCLPAAAPAQLLALRGAQLVDASANPLPPVDRQWQPQPSDPHDDLPAVLSHLRAVASAYPAEAVRAQLGAAAKPMTALPQTGEPLAMIVVPPVPERWHGVVPTAEFFAPAANLLRERGFRIVWLGTAAPSLPATGEPVLSPADLGETIAAVQAADMVVAPAGTVATLAQMLGKRLLVVCGSILPDRVIWNWSTSVAFFDPGLDCLGCHHLWGERRRAFCLRGDQACIRPALGPAVVPVLSAFLDGGPDRLSAAWAASQRTRMRTRRPAPELDLSRWHDDLTPI